MSKTNITDVIVKFVRNESGDPPGKLADAEIHFVDGSLKGLKLQTWIAARNTLSPGNGQR